MLKILPIFFAVVLCFSNFGFMNFETPTDNVAENISDTPVDHALKNHLTQDKNAQAQAQAAPVNEIFDFEDLTEADEQVVAGDAEIVRREQDILRLHWDIVPNAVKYEIFLDGGATLISFTNGIEIPVNDAANANFQVNAISLDGTRLQNKLPIVTLDMNPTAPLTTTEFDKMAYPPIYPVYSWIPSNGAEKFEIELIRDGKIVRRYFTQTQPQDDNFDFYDKTPVLDEGKYFWRVRGLTADNRPVTQWSTKNPANSFEVKHSIRFCALGDISSAACTARNRGRIPASSGRSRWPGHSAG